MTVVEPLSAAAEGCDSLVPITIADRLATLLRSLKGYDQLSNGVRSEIVEIIPGDAVNDELDDDAVAAIVKDLDDDAIAATWFKVVNILRGRRLEPVLSLHGLPYPRYPVGSETPSIPAVRMWDPPRMPESSPGGWSVLGFDVGFPVGIPSCELTCNADWIEYYARKGFHVLTYRTVRNTPPEPSRKYDWVFLADIDKPWAPAARQRGASRRGSDPARPAHDLDRHLIRSTVPADGDLGSRRSGGAH